MKEKMTVIEGMGIVGVLMWISILILRNVPFFANSTAPEVVNIIATTPYVSGALLATACLKQLVAPVFSDKPLIKTGFTKITYLIICLLVAGCGIAFEMANPIIINGTKTYNFMAIFTLILVQTIMYFLPTFFIQEIFDKR